MILAAKIYFFIFAVLTITGGIIGYVSKGSVPSVIAGSISGALLLAAALLLPTHTKGALIIALLVSLLLAAQFVPKFCRGRQFMPAGMMSILSLLGIIAAIATWIRN